MLHSPLGYCRYPFRTRNVFAYTDHTCKFQGGSYIYPANQGPAYHMGHGIAMGCLALAFTTATFQWWWFHRKNQELDRQAEAARLAGEETPSSFRFMV